MTLNTDILQPSSQQQPHFGWWQGETNTLHDSEESIKNSLSQIGKPLFVVLNDGKLKMTSEGTLSFDINKRPSNSLPVMAILPPLSINDLGDSSFCKDHGLAFPYVGGSMAHGISSPEIAEALGNAGMLGFIGAAGDSPEKVEKAILKMKSLPDPVPFGFNLIHSPSERGLEDEMVDLYIKHEVRLIEASAFLTMSLPLVRYRLHGIHQDEDGNIITPNRIIAKASRVEVATKFFSPPPEEMLKKLLESGVITETQAELARKIPVAQDLTSEADSGGHTDNRPAVSLHPTMIALKDRLQAEYNYSQPLRVGFGGGIGTPASAAASFAMGAAYIVTGSISQACVESGTSDIARQMLADAGQADVAMAPAGDMFEMGVTVQVLKRGTMFAMRAQKLYDLYRKYNSIEAIPEAERVKLEKTVFLTSLDDIWDQTRSFFAQRDPAQVELSERDPHHKMALVFRWYLGKSPRWAVGGVAERKMDFQIWCGAAMGAFNEWTKNSFMEKAENRKVAEVAMNMLYGSALIMRNNHLKVQGIILSPSVQRVLPQTLESIQKYI